MNSSSVPTVDVSTIAVLATQLADAESSQRAVEPLTAAHDLTLEDAYAIQTANTERRVAAGETVVGHKVGLTSVAMQQQLGVDQPDFGVVFTSMVVADGGELPRDTLIAPKVEAEMAFVLGADLVGDDLGEAEVRAAIAEVVISLEVIDSRIADWRITLPDTIADNASSARIVNGAQVAATGEVLAALLGDVITLFVDDVEVASGPGSAVLGDPVRALHWLATTLVSLGGGLRAGQIVLAGAVHAAVPLEAGTVVRASSDLLGDVSVRII